MEVDDQGVSGAVVKSQSTVQLMGYLPRHYPVTSPISSSNNKSKQNSISSSSHSNNSDIDIVVQVSTLILRSVQLLRRIIRRYTYGRIGRELTQLSLTVGAFERVMLAFILQELPSDTSMTTDNSALKDVLQVYLNDDREHAVLKGGIGSLLRQTARAFDSTVRVLEALESSSHSFHNNDNSHIFKFFSTAASAFGLLYVFKNRRMWNLKKILTGMAALDIIRRVTYRFSQVRRVKVVHSTVLLMLRMFLLCQHILERSRRMRRTASHRLLIDAPCVADYDDNEKNAAHLLVERVPLPREYYQHSSRDFGLNIFKLICDTTCAASCASSKYVSNNPLLRKIIGTPVFIMLIPYYVLFRRKAARYATRMVIDQPSINDMRRAWGLLGESKLSTLFHQMIAPAISVRVRIFVAANGRNAGVSQRMASDIGVHIFSARPIKSVIDGTWDNAKSDLSSELQRDIGLPNSRPVIFYVHGGGFFSRFFCQDLLNLSRWAVETGAVIVYPDYQLTPESQYPDALNQCASIYKWVTTNAGLGFTPSTVTMVGESAGGNIATALCLKIAEEGISDDSTVVQVSPPDGLLLCYPALNLHLSPSPSRFLHQNDPVLPVGILKMALNAYYPTHQESHVGVEAGLVDPYVSPGSAPDSMLQNLPPTSLVVGDLDPLLDDSVDFNTRLRRLRVPGTLRIIPGLTHGIFISNTLCKASQAAVDECRDIILEFLST